MTPVATFPPPSADVLRPGATFAGYRIDAVAGRGGMGTVYRATQLSLQRTVALKVVAAPLLGDDDARRRFEFEARAAAMLDHPSIVAVHDAGECDGVTFMAMRFVEGPDLRQLLTSERPGPERALAILAQVAGALDAAHAVGLVHRDVKPANILVATGDRAFLTDFGLTRLASATDGPTGAGEWVGSPDYAAPEQIRGAAVGPATDVYALGCVLFRMLGGRVPFQRDTTSARVWAHLHAAPPELSHIVPELDALDGVLARALAKDPADRHRSAGELARDAALALGFATPPGCGEPRATAVPATHTIKAPALAPEPAATCTELAAPGPLAAGRRIASRTLVGRDPELAALRAALQRATTGEPSLTVVAGEAGIGKSRLVQELASEADRDGMLVLTGACLGLSGGGLPYAPIAAALRALAGGPYAHVLDELEPQARAELARVVPELAGDAPTSPGAGEPGRYAQARLFELLLGLLRRLSYASPTLLVVEDLHWADPATLDFVRYVVAHARDERVAIVATYRTDELQRRHPLRALLAELSRSERFERVELQRLTRAEIARQLAGILDHPPGAELAAEIYERSQGNPFFAEELLAMQRSGTGGELPESLRDALLVRVDALSAEAQEMLRIVAAVGRVAADTLLGSVANCAERELLGALREAVAAHLLVQAGDGVDFRHALMREAIYADLLSGERVALHRRIASTLEQTSGSVNDGELARHWDAAGEHARAMTASIAAGQAATRTYAFRDALAHFSRAVELWPSTHEAHEHAALDYAGLLAAAAEAARLLGDVERAMTLCREALEAVDPAAAPQRAALLHERLGRYCTWDPQQALRSYREALDLLGPEPSAQRARVLGNEGLALMYLDRLEDARRRCEEAVEVARAATALAEEASAGSTLGVVLAFLGMPAHGEAQVRSALAIATQLGHAEDVGRAHIHLAEVVRYRGRIGEALAVCVEGERAARRLGVESSFGRYLSVNAAEDLFHLGRWDDAEQRLAAIDPASLEPTGRQMWLSVAGRLALASGDRVTARAHLEAACALGEDGIPCEQVPSVYAALAELALADGRPHDARRLVAEALELVGTGGDALNTPIVLAMGVRAEIVAAGAEPAQRRAARTAASTLVERLRRLIEAGGGASCPPQARAHLAACEVELARLDCEAVEQPADPATTRG